MRAPEISAAEFVAPAGGTFINSVKEARCAHCGADLCDHPDLIFAGVFVIEAERDAL